MHAHHSDATQARPFESVVAADRPCSSVAAELSPEGPVSAALDTTGVWIAPAPEQDMRTRAPRQRRAGHGRRVDCAGA